jgi:hypothetical protein
VEPTLTNWCTPCHASTVVGEDRRGAPVGMDFDGWERASAAATAIAAAAGPDGARMPPGGGMGDDERAGLVAWAECDAPGPSTVPVQPCAERIPFEGDAAGDGALCAAGTEPTSNAVTGTLTVSSPLAPEALACLCEVDGDLVVREAADAVVLPNLWRIGGALRVEGVNLQQLELPALVEAGSVSVTDARTAALDLDRLATVAGAFVVVRGAMPPDFGPQRLERVAGALVLNGVGEITTIELPRLEEVTGDLVIDGLPALRQVIHTSDLVTVGGSLRLTGNRSLLGVEDFGFLVDVGGDVEIGGGGDLRQVDALFDLQRIGGSLVIRDEPRLDAITGLTEVRQIGGAVRVRDTGVVALVALDALEEAAEIEVVGNASLSVWTWQAPEVVAGSVTIAGAAQLTSLPLAELRSVGGAFTLEQNEALASLSGLLGLEAVTGDLVIRENTVLPQAEIDRLLEGVVVGGTTTVEGNGL